MRQINNIYKLSQELKLIPQLAKLAHPLTADQNNETDGYILVSS